MKHFDDQKLITKYDWNDSNKMQFQYTFLELKYKIFTPVILALVLEFY